MKTTYRRLVRQRLEAAFKIRIGRNGLAPVTQAPFQPVPPVVIDLASGPFAARFPELARGKERKVRR